MKWDKIIIAVVSAVFAVVLYLFLPLDANKYLLKVEEEMNLPNLFTFFYADMDGDQTCEVIRVKNDDPVPAIVIQKADYQVIDQWNLSGEWVSLSSISLTDFDHDGFKEIVGFTFDRDSVWIHVMEALQPGGTMIHLALDRVQLYNGNQDWKVKCGLPKDMNGDQKDELCISIYSGFSLLPRQLYLFDIHQKTILAQEITIGNNIDSPLLVDVDLDGIFEITGNGNAPSNFKDKQVQFSDTCSWFMIYDQLLNFKTPPIPFIGSPSYLKVLSLEEKHRQYLITYYFTRSNEGLVNQFGVWEWLNDSLYLIRTRDFDYNNQFVIISADQSEEDYFYIAENRAILKINSRLEEVQRIKLDKPQIHPSYFPKDIDGDGMREHIFYTNYNMLSIMRNDYSHPVTLELDLHLQKTLPHISVFSRDRTHFVNLFRYPYNLLLSYSKNLFYPFRYLLLVLIFLAYYLVFSLLLRMQRRRIEFKQASEREIMQYQLANVMQQLDPHFMFNALSNISSYYHRGDKDYAQSYLAQMSTLMRTSMENSEKVTISLKEELRFVEDYLTLESLRQADRFKFHIDVDETYQEQIQLPKMLIQNFAENALKHGIRHLKGRDGTITIYSDIKEAYLEVHIEDNGIGRKNASEISTFGTGKGLSMTHKMLEIYKQLTKVRITYEITDLYDDNGIPSGTSVILRIPIA